MNGNMAVLDTKGVLDRTQFNVIGCDMVAELTPYHKRIATQVVLSANPNDGDVYALKGDAFKLAPTKIALLKLADAAGVRWNYSKCKPVAPSVCGFCRAAGDNCLKCDHHGTVAYQAVGAYQDAAGQWRPLIGTAEVDPSARDQVGKNDGKTEGERMRPHLLRHVEARAFNAAIRSLGVKQFYSPAELKKPFIVVRTYFDGYSDPDFKRLMLARAAESHWLLYGEPGTPRPEISAADEKVLQLVEGQPFADGNVVDQVTGEIIEPEPRNIANATGEVIRNPSYKDEGADDHGATQTGMDGTGAAPGDQPELPWNASEVPQDAEVRPRTLNVSSGEEFCAAVYKFLPRYRDASHPGKVNTFSMMASLNRVGIKTLSDARAWPHLCTRNDENGGKAA